MDVQLFVAVVAVLCLAFFAALWGFAAFKVK